MNYIRKIRKIKNNAKALSPVIASIILIAVTVAVSVVVAAWMGGMTIGLMGNAENAKVTNVSFTDNTHAVLTVSNNGANTVNINPAVTIDGNSGFTATGTLAVPKGQTETLTVTLTGTGTQIFTDGSAYAFSLTTAKGNTITYTATYSTAPTL